MEHSAERGHNSLSWEIGGQVGPPNKNADVQRLKGGHLSSRFGGHVGTVVRTEAENCARVRRCDATRYAGQAMGIAKLECG